MPVVFLSNVITTNVDTDTVMMGLMVSESSCYSIDHQKLYHIHFGKGYTNHKLHCTELTFSIYVSLNILSVFTQHVTVFLKVTSIGDCNSLDSTTAPHFSLYNHQAQYSTTVTTYIQYVHSSIKVITEFSQMFLSYLQIDWL